MTMTRILEKHYEQYDEDSRLLSRPGQVEYLTTMRYIDKYLSPGCHILEIGAGTGRYSCALADRGYAVHAVEPVQHNLDIFAAHLKPGMDITLHQGNALELHMFGDAQFDVTLLLGPMYHLMTAAEQRRAIKEAVRVTKPGGVIFAAYCMADSAILQHGFIRGNVHTLIGQGLLDTTSFRAFSRPENIIALHRKEDILALRGDLAVTPLHLLAADGMAHYLRNTLDTMDESTFALFLQYHFATCERQELLGHTNHALDIFRRNA